MVAAPFATEISFCFRFFWKVGSISIHSHQKISGAPWVNFLANLRVFGAEFDYFRNRFSAGRNGIPDQYIIAHLKMLKKIRGLLG